MYPFMHVFNDLQGFTCFNHFFHMFHKIYAYSWPTHDSTPQYYYFLACCKHRRPLGRQTGRYWPPKKLDSAPITTKMPHQQHKIPLLKPAAGVRRPFRPTTGRFSPQKNPDWSTRTNKSTYWCPLSHPILLINTLIRALHTNFTQLNVD